MIKTRLINQKILAGIGNVYSDEILFQVRLHPEMPVNEMDESTLWTVLETMHEVLEMAIVCQSDSDQLPDSYLIPRREEGADCPNCDRKVEQIQVSGRSAYFCPDYQSPAPPPVTSV